MRGIEASSANGGRERGSEPVISGGAIVEVVGGSIRAVVDGTPDAVVGARVAADVVVSTLSLLHAAASIARTSKSTHQRRIMTTPVRRSIHP